MRSSSISAWKTLSPILFISLIMFSFVVMPFILAVTLGPSSTNEFGIFIGLEFNFYDAVVIWGFTAVAIAMSCIWIMVRLDRQ